MNMYFHSAMAPWTLMSTNERPWTLLSAQMQSWAIKSTNEHGVPEQWALVSNHEYLRALITSWQQTLNCSWVPRIAHKSSWVLLRAPECSWLLKRLIGQKQTCYLWKWPLCSNLQISQSRFHQIIKRGIFLKSTRKWQLKNVQDGISRLLGIREICQERVYPFFFTHPVV